MSREVEHLRDLLTESNYRFDTLKEQFDTYLGLVKKIEEDGDRPDSIGGYESPSKKARRLSLVSRKAAFDELTRANEPAGSAKE